MQEDGKNRIYILALVLLASPFYLNDFANMYVKNWRWWLFIDFGTIIDQNGYKLVEKLSGYSPLGGMPAITNPVWNWIDLTFGLFMVGIFEELIFRGYMHTFIRKNSFSAVTCIHSLAGTQRVRLP
jgi:membrane protease YdiL (CAAX protease family)